MDSSTKGSFIHLEVGEHQFEVGFEGASLIVNHANGRRLDSAAAEVLTALGGAEPAWFPIVEALNDVARAYPQDWRAIRSGAAALALGPIARAQSARTETDRACLIALASVGRYEVGSNPTCDTELWNLVRYHRNEEVAAAALEHNEVLPPALAEHPDAETRARVAANPFCPPELLTKLAADAPAVCTAAARNPRCPPEALDRLARDSESMWVRQAVASNPSCPKRAYRVLMWDRHAYVRNAFVLNPSVPTRVAASRIYNDPTASVHAALASRVDLTARDLAWLERYARRDPANIYQLVRRRLAQHPSCPARLSRRLEVIDVTLSKMTVRQRERFERPHSTQNLRLGPTLAAACGSTLVLASLALLVIGIVNLFGSNWLQGLLLTWIGVLVVALPTLALVAVAKLRGPFLRWAPPRIGRLGTRRLHPLLLVYLAFIIVLGILGTHGTARYLDVCMAVLSIGAISGLRVYRRRRLA
jgi:hypothetical protein